MFNGEARTDRTGVGTIGVFGLQTRYDLREGFPAVTTKKLAWKSVVSELLWFVEGSTDERRLCEILHGTRDASKTTIWTENANADYWKPKALFEGDLGKVYGYQWRSWGPRIGPLVDQLTNLIEGIKKDPFGRRHLVVSFNPGELNDMALPPCHAMFQMYVSNSGALSCHMTQRSADFPLGVPFNIASYALLTHMVAQVCGLTVGEFIHSVGDAHIYLNQMPGVLEQLERTPTALPKLWLNPEIKDITKFTMDDIKLLDYESQAAIAYPFAT